MEQYRLYMHAGSGSTIKLSPRVYLMSVKQRQARLTKPTDVDCNLLIGRCHPRQHRQLHLALITSKWLWSSGRRRCTKDKQGCSSQWLFQITVFVVHNRKTANDRSDIVCRVFRKAVNTIAIRLRYELRYDDTTTHSTTTEVIEITIRLRRIARACFVSTRFDSSEK